MLRIPTMMKLTYLGVEYVFSDHNRSPVSENLERQERGGRTARAQRKRYFVADKRNWQADWTLLPVKSTNTVDENMGAEAMETMYALAVGDCTLSMMDPDGQYDEYIVHITNMSVTVTKRGLEDHYYDVSISFEEV